MGFPLPWCTFWEHVMNMISDTTGQVGGYNMILMTFEMFI